MEQLKKRTFTVYHAVTEHREVARFRQSYMKQQMQRKQGRPSKVALAAEMAVRAAVAAAESVSAEGSGTAIASLGFMGGGGSAESAATDAFGAVDAALSIAEPLANPAAIEFKAKEADVRAHFERKWSYDETLDVRRCQQLDAQFMKTDTTDLQRNRALQSELGRIDVQLKRMAKGLKSSRAPVHHGYVSPRRVHASNFAIGELQHARGLFTRRVVSARGSSGMGPPQVAHTSSGAERNRQTVLNEIAEGGGAGEPQLKQRRLNNPHGAAGDAAAPAEWDAPRAGAYLRSTRFAVPESAKLSQRMAAKIDMVLRELNIPVPTAGKSIERARRLMPTRSVLEQYDQLRHDIVLCLSLQKHVARLEGVVGEELKRRDDLRVAKAEKTAARAAAKRKRDEVRLLFSLLPSFLPSSRLITRTLSRSRSPPYATTLRISCKMPPMQLRPLMPPAPPMHMRMRRSIALM